MSANPAFYDHDFSALPTIDSLDLNAVVGGAEQEGWGQWAGKYVGAGLGGLGGAALGTGGFSWSGPGALAAGAFLGSAGAAAGYDYGGKVGNWLTGGQ
jgi:hypothetical protein